MLGAIATDPVQSSPSVAPLLMCRRLQARLFERLGPPVPWNRTTYTGLVILVVLWAARMYATWATWGNLTIDGGHEMYVPAVLSEGKMLYRDIWWQYTPLSVYLNAYLFRLFGENLNVLYWAGSLSALASALLLYAAGMRLSSWLAGWTTAAIVIIQAFNPYIFCFPLPYSFAAVYGCLAACLFVFFALLAAHSDQWMWTFGAASTAALALLDKLEFGAACYATLLVLIAARCIQQHSWKRIGRDFLAILPGAAVCGLVAAWMISIRGVEFITQENIISWPTTYYMKTYGKMWLAATGFAINGPALGQAALRTALVAAVFAEICMVLRRARSERRAIFTLTLVVVAVACVIGVWRPQAETVFRSIFLPRDMVLYVVIAALAACWYFWEQRTETALAAALLLTFSALLAFRILLGMNVSDYPIYYNGPVILGFLLLAPSLLPRSARWRVSEKERSRTSDDFTRNDSSIEADGRKVWLGDCLYEREGRKRRSGSIAPGRHELVFSLRDLLPHTSIHVRAGSPCAREDDRRTHRRDRARARALSDLVEPDVLGNGSTQFRHRFRPPAGRLFENPLSFRPAVGPATHGRVGRRYLRAQTRQRTAR